MDGRIQTGRKAVYLCSGLVYCSCGAKMHGLKSRRKGYEYHYYYCSAKCGAPVIRMEEVDAAATNYLKELLSTENQKKIAAALRKYQTGEKSQAENFNTIIKKRIGEKQREYDALMGNLKAGALPPKVVEAIGRQMQELQDEMDALRETTPPKDVTTDQITAWLEALKAAAAEKAFHLLVERIDVKEKTDISITSTLNSVLGEHGSGSRI
ncbi:MAG: zinc ribbon domain-containing protein [Firmicutes bacterium]|nr:zinc ribbon domain-containing protein [Bacillota bacterium]